MENLMETPPADQTNNGQPPVTDPPAGDPPAGDPPPGDPPKAEGAPETYEFKPAEGKTFDPGFIESYSKTAKELNLSQEQAQALIDKLSPDMEKRQMAQIEKVRNEWAETSKADKEFGGEKLDENLGIAKQALEKFGTPELKELINSSGLGNHPEMIRFFYRAGKAISSDTFVGGRNDGKGAPKTFNDFADKLYK